MQRDAFLSLEMSCDRRVISRGFPGAPIFAGQEQLLRVQRADWCRQKANTHPRVHHWVPYSLRCGLLRVSSGNIRHSNLAGGFSAVAPAKTPLIFARVLRLTERLRGPQPSKSLTGVYTPSPAYDRLKHGQ